MLLLSVIVCDVIPLTVALDGGEIYIVQVFCLIMLSIVIYGFRRRCVCVLFVRKLDISTLKYIWNYGIMIQVTVIVCSELLGFFA